jgi:hypothetical protein
MDSTLTETDNLEEVSRSKMQVESPAVQCDNTTAPDVVAQAVKEKKNGSTCGICGSVYTMGRNLYRHILNAHKNVRHPCKKCGFFFKRQDYLVKHMRRKHQN